MKKAKKLTAFLLLAAFVLAFIVPVTAMADGTGSITITNATSGEKYAIYKLFDATVGLNGEIAYTLPTNKTLTENNEWFEVDSAGNVQAKENVDVSGKAFRDWATEFGVQIGDSSEAISDTVTFSDVPYGYYYITSSLGTLITVTSTNPNATVVDKNQGPSWDGEGKTITNSDINSNKKSTANYGDKVSFKIGVNATQYVGAKAVEEYYITDTLGKGFDYKSETITVSVKKSDETVITLSSGAATEGNENVYTMEKTTNEENTVLKITIPWLEDYGANAVIEVTYDATVNDDAVIAGNGNKNTATYDYKLDDESTGSHESEPKETTTYTYALGIHKIDGTTKESLAGAKFEITGIKAKETGTTGVYEYSPEGTVEKFATDENGILVIKGVKAGTYNVTETVAPAGYNKIEGFPITADVEKTESYTTTVTTYYDAEGNVIDTDSEDGEKKITTYPVNVTGMEVENYSGSTLPSTGGIGTTIFYVVGGVLVVGAGVLLITRKRMSVEK